MEGGTAISKEPILVMALIERDPMATKEPLDVGRILGAALCRRVAKRVELEREEMVKADHPAGTPVEVGQPAGPLHRVKRGVVHPHEVEALAFAEGVELGEGRGPGGEDHVGLGKSRVPFGAIHAPREEIHVHCGTNVPVVGEGITADDQATQAGRPGGDVEEVWKLHAA